MKIGKISDKKEYDEVMQIIETLLQKATKKGGIDKLSVNDGKKLDELSVLAEQYEDSISLMPIKVPDTLTGMIRFKMFELNLKQKQLAKVLGMSETRISEILTGKRRVNIDVAKKLHSKLKIDASFILKAA